MSSSPIEKHAILAAVIEVLEQGQSLLLFVKPEHYTMKLPVVYNASIGTHYRHCLDHFKTLLEPGDSPELNYDLRQRDPRIEEDTRFALDETRRLLAICKDIPDNFTCIPLNVRCKVSYFQDESPVAQSSFGREAMYSVAHAVHHYALIGVMCGLLEIDLPAGFGIAPSTIQHTASKAA